MTKRGAVGLAAILATAAVLAGLVVASGLRFYTVMTPSMGQVAPVGTLVVTRPAAEYWVGDIVTYERGTRSYTHRIITANADGTFITKGDLNGAADPLPVERGQVVGRAIWVGPGLGWLWQGLPWLALGFLVVFTLSLLSMFGSTLRWVVRISGWTLVFCAVALWLRPWVSLTQLTWSPSSGDGVDMHVVNTGLFPLDVLGKRLVSGQDAIVHVTQIDPHGYFTLTPGLAFTWWEQVGLFLLCLIPLALTFLIKPEEAVEPTRAIEDEPAETTTAEHADPDWLFTDESSPGVEASVGGMTAAALPHPASVDQLAPAEAESGGSDPANAETDAQAERSERRRRLILIAAIVFAMIIGVAVVTFTTTSSALTAKVTNNTNTAGTRTFFKCRDAVSSLGAGSTYVAWALGTAQSAGTDESDLSGNSRAGRYLTGSTTSTTSVGCLRDTPAASVSFNGTSQCLYLRSGSTTPTAPTTFSVEAWFMTTSTALNGKIIGLGDSRTTSSETTYDRHIYLDKDGRVIFGVYSGAQKIVASPAGPAYNDGKWHHVVGTYSTSTGMALYVDGSLAASAAQTTINNDTGYWKVGCGTLSTWADAAGATTIDKPAYFTGQIQYAAVYTVVLSATQVKEHYLAGAS